METVKPEHVLWFKPQPGGGQRLICSCGWSYFKKREKLMAAAAAKHQEKYGAEWANEVLDLEPEPEPQPTKPEIPWLT